MPAQEQPRRFRIAVVNSHPIQYFAPLYAYLQASGRFEMTAIYCTDYSIRGEVDPGFKEVVRWDLDLLSGYRSIFLRGAEGRTPRGFWSLIGLQLWSEIRSDRYDAVLIHGHQFAAYLVAMLAALAIYGFSRLRGATTETMVLLGIAQVFLFNALLALLEYMASEQTLQQVVFWSLGSLTKASWPKIGVALAVLVVVAPPLAVQAWRLTALRLGDEKARSLGINVERLRLQVLLLVSVLAATAVAFVGTVGFVGLVGPHVARMLVGEDQRYFLAASALAGALLMALTSIVSKLVVPGAIIPIGIITSLIGVPFFLSLVLTRRRQLW